MEPLPAVPFARSPHRPFGRTAGSLGFGTALLLAVLLTVPTALAAHGPSAVPSPAAPLPAAPSRAPAPSFSGIRPANAAFPSAVNATFDLATDTELPGNVRPANFLGMTSAVASVNGSDIAYLTAQGGSSGGNGEIVQFNTTTGALGSWVSASDPNPTGIVYVPPTNSVWAVSEGGNSPYSFNFNSSNITVASLSPFEVTHSLPVTGCTGVSAAYDPIGQQVIVTCPYNGYLIAYNATTFHETPFTAGVEPVAVAYDAAFNDIIVANRLNDTISVLTASTFTLQQTITVISAPDAVAVDDHGLVYVSQYNSSSIAVVNLTTASIVREFLVGTEPLSLSFDPGRDILYATGSGSSDNVTAYNVSAHAYYPSIIVGTGNHQVTYDPSSDQVVVVNDALGTIGRLNATTRTFEGNTTAGFEPGALASDDTDARLYFDEAVSGDLGWLSNNGSTYDPIPGIQTDPLGVYAAWDSVDDAVWMGGARAGGPTGLTEVATTGASAKGYSYNFPIGQIGYAADVNRLFLVNPVHGGVVPISTSDGTVYGAISVVFAPSSLYVDPFNGYAYVGSASNSPGNPNTSPVTVFDTSTSEVLRTAVVGYEPTAFVADPTTGAVYAFAWGSQNVSVLNGYTSLPERAVPLPTPAAYTSEAVYDPVDGVFALAEQNLNQVWLFDPANDSVVARIPVGLTPTDIAYDYAGGYLAVANEQSGTISIIRDPDRYSVTFQEKGLPSGSGWSVTSGNLTRNAHGPTISFYTQPGTLSWDVAGWPQYYAILAGANGSVFLSSTNLTVEVLFHYSGPVQSVQFNELGLPFQQLWSVTVGNETLNSTGGYLIFHLPESYYNFTVGPVPGYTADPRNGSFNLSTSRANFTIDWSPTLYPVSFTEVGLPAGTSWTVSLGGTTYLNHSTTNQLTVWAPNGTYHYTVGQVSGYSAAPSNGSLVLNGSGATELILFSKLPAPSQAANSVGPTFDGAYVEIGALVGAIALIVVALIAYGRERRGGLAPPPDGPGSPPPAEPAAPPEESPPAA